MFGRFVVFLWVISSTDCAVDLGVGADMLEDAGGTLARLLCLVVAGSSLQYDSSNAFSRISLTW